MKYIIIGIGIIFSILALTSCGKLNDVVIKESNTQIVDVRTVEEFNEGHISGSINIPLPNIEDKSGLSDINKEKEISIYCKSGRRSSIAKRKLEEFGYKNVKDLGAIENASKSTKLAIIK